MKQGQKNSNVYGFTLIELLVAISILAILSAVAVVAYSGITAKARDGQRIKDLQAIKQALELYRSDLHSYPAVTDDLNTYLSPIPTDKISGRNYYYSASSDGLSFILCAKKEGSNAFPDTPSGCSSASCGTAGNCDIGISSQ